MDKWESLRDTIQKLHDNNKDKQDVEATTRFLLNLMGVLYKGEQEVLSNVYREIKVKYNEFRLSKKDTEVLKFMIHLMEEIELYAKQDEAIEEKEECVNCSFRYLCKDRNDCLKEKR